MKKLMIFAVMMLSAMTASAQQEVGTWSVTPKVGINLAKVTDANDASMQVGLVAGADVNYQIAEKFAVSAGVFYSMQGAKQKYREGGISFDEKVKLDYINIPILAQFYVVPGLALKAGIQPAFNVKHKHKIESGGDSAELDIDHFKSFDFSIPLGVSYEFSNFVIDARYNLGLTKIVDVDGSSSKNSVIQFTVGYIIPFNN